jgi:predicted lipopolysaccharide heptosyltransferase III
MNILLLQLKRIGDLILTTPAIVALREKFPRSVVTLIVSQNDAPLLPAITGIDRTFVIQRKLSDVKVFHHVAREKFDYCIDFTRNDRSASLTFLSGARKRIVSSQVKVKSKLRLHAYNEFVEYRERDLHTVDFHLSLLEPLGIRDASPAIRLEVPHDAHRTADVLLRRAKIDKPFIIFHPGAARAERFWGTQRWAEIIEHAQLKCQIIPVLAGGSWPLEKSHLAEIKSKLHQPFVDLSGKIDLLTLTALIARARLLVTLDSAPMHLAAATGTPQVALFGPGNPFHWRPRESPAVILRGESASPVTEFSPKQRRLPMHLISTQSVIDAMESLLSAPAAPGHAQHA